MLFHSIQQNLPSLANAIEGFVSAKLVAVPTADSGASNALKCVVLIIEAVCLPGAEHSSDKFRCTSGCRLARGSNVSCFSLGTSSTKCHPLLRTIQIQRRKHGKFLQHKHYAMKQQASLGVPGSAHEEAVGIEERLLPTGATGWVASRNNCSTLTS